MPRINQSPICNLIGSFSSWRIKSAAEDMANRPATDGKYGQKTAGQEAANRAKFLAKKLTSAKNSPERVRVLNGLQGATDITLINIKNDLDAFLETVIKGRIPAPQIVHFMAEMSRAIADEDYKMRPYEAPKPPETLAPPVYPPPVTFSVHTEQPPTQPPKNSSPATRRVRFAHEPEAPAE